jgi:pyridinium-3,5-biscarboxylic acid mononucleotide synthase
MKPESTPFARLDDLREARTGIPEIVWGENKTVAQLESIVRRMTEKQSLILVSRLDAEKGRHLSKEFPSGIYHPEARVFSLQPREKRSDATRGTILILAAGTSDIPVAEEAFVTASLLGSRIERAYDVGVAGIHRLFEQMDRIREASVLIVVAGMEGALPSVVAGLVGKPIVAVPTSIGYGTGLGGVAALLAMLNGCAPGVTVVNIDNGVGAAVAAHLINRA